MKEVLPVKIKIGNKNVLYPMPVTVVGAMVNGRPNFIAIAHVGILTRHQPHLISLSMSKMHYTNAGIKETKTFSVNLMSVENMVPADYVGTFSGKAVDKSQVFEVFYGELKTAPIIAGCPLSMECKLYDVYDLPQFDVFIGEVVETYADENVLTDGKADLSKVNPLLFDMTSVQYWSLGKAVGRCWNISRQYNNSK